jgi:hypothetical protein
MVGRVRGVAVELDDEAGVGPVEVDLVALDGEVPSRAAQALGVEEREEAVLGVAWVMCPPMVRVARNSRSAGSTSNARAMPRSCRSNRDGETAGSRRNRAKAVRP